MACKIQFFPTLMNKPSVIIGIKFLLCRTLQLSVTAVEADISMSAFRISLLYIKKYTCRELHAEQYLHQKKRKKEELTEKKNEFILQQKLKDIANYIDDEHQTSNP